MTPALEEAHRLQRLALRDRGTFDLLLPLPQATLAAIGFHAQQAVEKSLKAVCTLRSIEVRRTHDLAALAQALIDDGVALPLSPDEFRTLNPFAVEYRYDDEITSTLTREDLNSLVTKVLNWSELQF
ncbi:MAG TPA: HEPN domain-containing protein [Rhodoferax sp.]|jgi:HEPN domain-containing protein|nr:HEPN domain-containing protein [Rhodoferax sp.]HPW28381.1 HEPN domain-containing protein [Rhodoferax sp.]